MCYHKKQENCKEIVSQLINYFQCGTSSPLLERNDFTLCFFILCWEVGWLDGNLLSLSIVFNSIKGRQSTFLLVMVICDYDFIMEYVILNSPLHPYHCHCYHLWNSLSSGASWIMNNPQGITWGMVRNCSSYTQGAVGLFSIQYFKIQIHLR